MKKNRRNDVAEGETDFILQDPVRYVALRWNKSADTPNTWSEDRLFLITGGHWVLVRRHITQEDLYPTDSELCDWDNYQQMIEFAQREREYSDMNAKFKQEVLDSLRDTIEEIKAKYGTKSE